MSDDTILRTRTPQQDRELVQRAVQKALDEVDLNALRHKMRIETGTCYVRDLAWAWDLSPDAILDRLKAAGVEPVSKSSNAHLYDVEEATQAIQSY